MMMMGVQSIIQSFNIKNVHKSTHLTSRASFHHFSLPQILDKSSLPTLPYPTTIRSYPNTILTPYLTYLHIPPPLTPFHLLP